MDIIATVASLLAALFALSAAWVAWRRDPAAASAENAATVERTLREMTETLRGVLDEHDRGLRRDMVETATRQDGALSTMHRRMEVKFAESETEAARGWAKLVADTGEAITRANAALVEAIAGLGRGQGERLDGFGRTQREEAEKLRALVGERLDTLRAGNEAKLEQMRAAVDEKLQTALEQRLTESFRHVTEQFAQIQQAIGDVRTVAGEVGNLKRLFSNVKARGGWGEAQIGALLEDALPPGAWETNKRLTEGGEVVEFALRVPSKGEEAWLPIDAKFPTETYDRLLLAAETGDRDAEAAARRDLERCIRTEARRIGGKYVVPPRTVDFAVMYLPTESLFAEVGRIPGLVETLRRECRVMVMGPLLLPALLHTIRVGHLTMAIGREASRIGEILAATKTAWEAMDKTLATLGKRAQLVVDGVEDTRVKARAVGRRLKDVGTLDYARAEEVLGLDAPAAVEETGDEERGRVLNGS